MTSVIYISRNSRIFWPGSSVYTYHPPSNELNRSRPKKNKTTRSKREWVCRHKTIHASTPKMGSRGMGAKHVCSDGRVSGVVFVWSSSWRPCRAYGWRWWWTSPSSTCWGQKWMRMSMWFEAGSACFGFAGARRVIFLKNRTSLRNLTIFPTFLTRMFPLSHEDAICYLLEL